MPDLIAVRLALGLGDQELEQRLRPALDADDDLLVVVHCLAADHVVQSVEANEVDAVVLAAGAASSDRVGSRAARPGTGADGVAGPRRRGHRRTSAGARWSCRSMSSRASLRQAIKTAARGERWVAPRTRQVSPVCCCLADDRPARRPICRSWRWPAVRAVPAARPWRSIWPPRLGAVAPTVLVDLDCTSPSVAAYLNLDPSRNVCTLAHAVREAPQAWAPALQQELQPLHPRSPEGVVLCGPPKREMRADADRPGARSGSSRSWRRRYRYVDPRRRGRAAGNRSALRSPIAPRWPAAQHVLRRYRRRPGQPVARAHRLGQLERVLHIEHERISLAINRHDARYHHTRAEIEWHLGAAAAVVIPHDYGGIQTGRRRATPAGARLEPAGGPCARRPGRARSSGSGAPARRRGGSPAAQWLAAPRCRPAWLVCCAAAVPRDGRDGGNRREPRASAVRAVRRGSRSLPFSDRLAERALRERVAEAVSRSLGDGRLLVPNGERRAARAGHHRRRSSRLRTPRGHDQRGRCWSTRRPSSGACSTRCSAWASCSR